MKLRGLLRRACGLETEYGIAPECLTKDMLRSRGQFTQNGSRIYIDLNHHPEAATPECENGEQVTVFDRANERILLRQLLYAARCQHLRRASLYKNNTARDHPGSHQLSTHGAHENYQTLLGIEDEYSQHLAAFYATRIIWAGAGLVVPGDPFSFRISQRSRWMQAVVAGGSTNKRGLFYWRPEPLADTEKYQRLQAISGDSNILFWPSVAKIDLTRLFLLMIENNALKPLELTNLINDLRRLDRDLSLKFEFTTDSHKSVSAVAVQWHYLSQAIAFASKHNLQYYYPILTKVAGWLTALESGDFFSLRGKVDWITKLSRLALRAHQLGSRISPDKAVAVDLAYHNLNDPKKRPQTLRQGTSEYAGTDPVWAQAAIELAETTAPDTTRAHLRSRFWTAAKHYPHSATFDWCRLSADGLGTVVLNDPMSANDPRVDTLISAMKLTPNN